MVTTIRQSFLRDYHGENSNKKLWGAYYYSGLCVHVHCLLGSRELYGMHEGGAHADPNTYGLRTRLLLLAIHNTCVMYHRFIRALGLGQTSKPSHVE